MKIHIVKQGDSLYSLSQKYGVPLQKIVEANPQISNPNVLAVGDKVKIPTAPVTVPDNSEVYYKHTVKQGDTLWKLSKAWGIPLKDMVEANTQLKNPNVLVVGEIVNIPKKASYSSPTQPGSTASNNINEKTQVGGKEYTGPKVQPAEVVPTPAPTPAPAPAPTVPAKPAPPAPAKPATKPAPKIAPETNSAPHPNVNIAPIQTANPAPNVNNQIAPVQENASVEMQSLFVQVTVPDQEVASKAQVKPVAEKKDACDNEGYPGLGGNPYLNATQQASPYMNMNAAPTYVQPASYEPDCISPYNYSGNMYHPYMSPEQWNPNNAPMVSPEQWNPNNAPMVSPEQWNPNNAPMVSPEQWNPNASPYGQSANHPWSCGCGAMHVQPVQTYTYDMPMYSPYSAYGYPNVHPAYGGGMPNQGVLPISSNIPSNPQYPGVGNYSQPQHNRVPEIQDPVAFVQDYSEAANSVKSEITDATKSAASKAKTLSQDSNKKRKSTAKPQVTTSSRRTESTKKRKNPWTSN